MGCIYFETSWILHILIHTCVYSNSYGNIYLSIYLFHCSSLSFPIYLTVFHFLWKSLSLSIYLSLPLSLSLSLSLSLCIYICMYIYVSNIQSACEESGWGLLVHRIYEEYHIYECSMYDYCYISFSSQVYITKLIYRAYTVQLEENSNLFKLS